MRIANFSEHEYKYLDNLDDTTYEYIFLVSKITWWAKEPLAASLKAAPP